MRNVVMFNLITLDGFFECPNADISWHNVDEEFNTYAITQWNACSGLIFSQKTYQLMASYWPTPDGIRDDPVVAGKMNALPKFVFSRTLSQVDWNNTQLIKEDAPDSIRKLKQQARQDLAEDNLLILGSADLSASLARAGLIDEYRLIINPLVLGQGTPLFKASGEPLRLNLVSTLPFKN